VRSELARLRNDKPALMRELEEELFAESDAVRATLRSKAEQVEELIAQRDLRQAIS
jgi:hypothetical protein